MAAAKRSDLDLIACVSKGDSSSFEELISRYGPKVLNLALRVTRNSEDAEEVVQDVFVTVFRKIEGFERKSAFSSWLYRVTMNTAFMKIRARNRRKAISLEDLDPNVQLNYAGERSDTTDTDYLSCRHELRRELQVAVDKLPEEYRAIFILRDVDGLSNQVVSEVLGLSVPAVKSRLHRSRVLLRESLQGYYDSYTTGNDHRLPLLGAVM
jgi:RNA polymerase sigma-70 factor (ECF subfamily)